MGKHAAGPIERQIIRLNKLSEGDYSDVAKMATLGKVGVVAAGALALFGEGLNVIGDVVQHKPILDNILTAGEFTIATAVAATFFSYVEYAAQGQTSSRHLGPNPV